MEFDYIDWTWDDIRRSYHGMRRAEGDMPGRGSGGSGQTEAGSALEEDNAMAALPRRERLGGRGAVASAV